MTRRKAALAVFSAMVVAGCSSSSGGGGAVGGGGSSIIDLSGGGSALTANGGDAGYWYIETYAPGGVKLKRSGAADTSFTIPAYARGEVDLGSNGVTISTDTTVSRLAAGAADPGAGTLYVVAGLAALYVGNGTGTVPDAAEQVTGLKVNAGVTLELAADDDPNGDGYYDISGVDFAGDVDVAGTLKPGPLAPSERGGVLSRDRAGLSITGRHVFVRASGKVDTRGGDAAVGSDERGGDGGFVRFSAHDLFVNEGVIDVSGGKGDGIERGGNSGVSSNLGYWVQVQVNDGSGWGGGGGVILNAGQILCVGGDGGDGGTAAEINLIGNSFVINTGSLVQTGGTGSAGYGGSGDWDLELRSRYASVVNSGALVAAGGNGTDGGASGGYVYLYGGDGGNAGDVVNSGSVTVNGGDATAAGSGGDAGEIYLYAWGGIRTGGALSLDGGDGKGASGSGGAGGYMELRNSSGSEWFSGNELAVKPIQISSGISARGGACVDCTGGRGGDFEVYQSGGAYEPDAAGVELLGYARAVLNGGDGLDTGGDVSLVFAVYTYGNGTFPAGSIVNEVDLATRGGDAKGTDGSGGGGGDVSLYWEIESSAMVGLGGDITNTGAIDMSGGGATGSQDGGGSGGLEWYAPGTITNSGRILNRGGDAQDGTGGEGDWYELWFVAHGDVVNTGAIDTTGGAGASGGEGADGWDYHTGFYAAGQVRNSASLVSAGGRATDDAAGTSGNGGQIELFSQSRPTLRGGTLSVAAGAGGATPGAVGEIWVDSVDVTPANGVL